MISRRTHRRTRPLGRGERFRGPLVDIILGAGIDHADASVDQPYEALGRVPPLPSFLAPGRPRRLRGDPHRVRSRAKSGEISRFRSSNDPQRTGPLVVTA
ncbi:hypothetical protein [Streptomyces mutabilis]|uniref:Uncharacterized protein n=1 Tax=Streptomyces mutabilis TaxID=67332 RepID=A0A086N8F1_9ACTN|nr:hypothetical protein [Streptomyces mutabilis]KFG77419.1 hypothetical protein FM21_15740 [Streptomyces mutabilis]